MSTDKIRSLFGTALILAAFIAILLIGYASRQNGTFSETAVIVVKGHDPTGHIARWPDGLLGYSDTDLLEQPVSRIIPVKMRTEHARHFAEAVQRGKLKDDKQMQIVFCQAIHADNEMRDVMIIVEPTIYKGQFALEALIHERARVRFIEVAE